METAIAKFGQPRQQVSTQLDAKGNAATIYTHDEYGLALDPRLWCKRSCKDCNGTGNIWKVGRKLEDGTKQREMTPCPRATRYYQAMRRAVEDRLYAAKQRGGMDEECRELERIHAENGHGIKVTKSPFSPQRS